MTRAQQEICNWYRPTGVVPRWEWPCELPSIFVVRTLHLEPWAGRWVAIDSAGSVRCDAVSLSELLSRTRSSTSRVLK